jgi:GR25 family glycosyltransferase involved in LPS biosynthesis
MDANLFNHLLLQIIAMHNKQPINQSIDEEDRKRKLLVQNRQVVGLSKITCYLRHYQMMKEIATVKLLGPYFKNNCSM